MRQSREGTPTVQVTLLLHIERAGDEVVWWAESNDVPGFSGAANTLLALREQCRRALEDLFGESLTVRERLMATELTVRSDNSVADNGPLSWATTNPLTGRPVL